MHDRLQDVRQLLVSQQEIKGRCCAVAQFFLFCCCLIGFQNSPTCAGDLSVTDASPEPVTSPCGLRTGNVVMDLYYYLAVIFVLFSSKANEEFLYFMLLRDKHKQTSLFPP